MEDKYYKGWLASMMANISLAEREDEIKLRYINPEEPRAGVTYNENSMTETYVLNRREAYEMLAKMDYSKAAQKKYRRQLFGTRYARFVRWAKGLFSYVRVDWRPKPIKRKRRG